MTAAPHLASARQKAAASRAAASASVAAQAVTLRDGTRLYPDTAPGTGWVLAMKRSPKRYLATKDAALAHWRALKEQA
jgi:hypothetical protein